ncbi:hypothetical protein [Sulfurovum sp.]|uniref:hypothetical protein n=1 Tax=Sulfurovum sp. TaxID=1969726 RepID=UPI0028683539|nr:hypothetical protein [Sulfurovum sp.]
MKKLGLVLLSIIIIASLYYFSTGSEQLKVEMKAQVNKELVSLQTQGFSVQNREISEEKEHFILSFDEPEKISQFFTSKGAKVDAQEIEALKGLQVGVDVAYLADAYSAVSFDMYPVTLPSVLTNSALSDEDQKIVEQLKKIMEKKALLVHLSLNKLGTGFKGHVKDIDEVIQGADKVHFTVASLTFSGDIKEDKIAKMQQELKDFSMDIANELSMNLSGLTSQYILTGKSTYDYKTDYSIKKVILDGKSEFNIVMDELDAKSESFVKDGLATGSLQTKAKKIAITEDQKNTILETLVFNMKANNFDIKAFEQLEKIDVNDEKAMNAVFQQLISQGIKLDISDFSIAKITTEGQTIDGFSMNTTFNIDKSLNIAALQQNPMLAINAINANLDIALSQGLFAMVAQHPQAVMAMMLFQPKDVNNQKVYKIELQNGSLKVNDIPAM